MNSAGSFKIKGKQMTNTERADALDLQWRAGEWWIIGHDPEMGPYLTKHEAQDDLRGVKKFYKKEATIDVEDIIS